MRLPCGVALLAVWASASMPALAAPEEPLREARAALERGDVQGAERHLEEALRTGPGMIRAEALLELGRLARRGGDFAGEAERLRQSIATAESLAPARERDVLLARALGALGVNEREAGRNAEALALYDRALALGERAGDVPTRIDALGKRSVALLRAGSYDRALVDAQQAHALALEGASPMSRASTVFALAQVHAHLWDLERAAELWTEALEAYRRAGSELGVGLTARQRMDTWFALGDLDRAAEDGETALSLLRASASLYLPGVWARVAHIQALRGRTAAASSAEAEAVNRAARSNHPAYVWNELGLTALARRDLEVAERRFERALELASADEDREYRWRGLDGLGRVALARGDAPLAERRFREAVSWIDRLRRELPHPSQRATLVSGRMEPYERLVLSLYAQSRAPDDDYAREALEVADASRARTLSEILQESGRSEEDEDLEAIRAEEEALAGSISELQRAILSSREAEGKELLKELQQRELDYEALSVRLRRRDLAFQDLANPVPLELSEIAAVLESDEALVSFLVGEDGGVAWVLTRHALFSYSIPGRETLERQVSLLLGLARAGGDDVRQPSRELGRLLIDPALDALGATSRLILVSSGTLGRLPFALLRTADGGRLVERFSISTVPSGRLLTELRRRPRSPTDAVLGVASSRAIEMDPGFAALYGADATIAAAAPLAEAEEEARDAAEALPLAPTVLGVDASSETRLKELDLGRYRVLHFAAHAALDEAIPRRSALVLRADALNDGLLQLDEIGRLPLAAELVVVSSCSSYLGQTLRGEGFLSLSRGFLSGGARAVAASLWPVSDRETHRLMQLFYGSLGEGETPDRALREAQLAMIAAGGKSAEPSSWAGFVLTGDVSSPLVEAPSTSRSLGSAPLGLAVAALAAGLFLWARARRRVPP